MQKWTWSELEEAGVLLLHEPARVEGVGLGVLAVDIGEAGGQRAIDEDGDRLDLVLVEEFEEAVDHALGAAEAEGGDDDAAAEAGGAGDDGVKLLDERVVGVERAGAVGALGDEDVDIANEGGVGQEAHVAAAEVAGEDEATGLVVFLEVELDGGGAEDVAGVEVGEGDAGDDLLGCAVGRSRRFSMTHSTSCGSKSGSGGVERRYGRLATRESSRWMRALSRSMMPRMSAVAGVV